MGKVEKVIVLSVLFLIALILVVSLTVEDPLNKSRVVEAGAPPSRATTPIVAPPAGEVASTAAPQDATALLSTQVAPASTAPATTTLVTPSPAAPAGTTPAPGPVAGDAAAPAAVVVPPPALPPGALLKKLDGLQDSILPDMKLYTWKDGDSYKSIAQSYYGSQQKLTVLKRSNEGRNDVQPGQQIFIPVFDTDATSMSSTSSERLGAAKADKSDAKAIPVSSGTRIHVVKEGESLWKIAKIELGNGERWKEIYELNRDVLAKPESVHKGQRLRIP